MNSREVRKRLLSRISDEEWSLLEKKDPSIYISAFNRDVILGMRAGEEVKDLDTDPDTLRKLHQGLAAYLDRYMSDHKEAHKWIIISCICLTAVAGIPMHPREAAGWQETGGNYYCPSYDPSEGSLCYYCACSAMDQ